MANTGGLYIHRKGDQVCLQFSDSDSGWSYEFTMNPTLAYEAARRITVNAMKIEDGVPLDDSDEYDDEEYE